MASVTPQKAQCDWEAKKMEIFDKVARPVKPLEQEKNKIIMKTRIKIIMLFYFITIGQVFGQVVYYSVCNVYTINSQNDKFFLRTIPFDNIDKSPTGKTIVFNSDSTKIYEIPRKFENNPKRKEIFLSNDGNTIAYVIDREFKWNDVQSKSIEIFKNGVPFKQYQFTDLINCDSDNED
jgi:hypothetical protein